MKRTVEIFSAGCAMCDELVRRVNTIASPSCDVVVLDMQQPDVVERAALADCCAGKGPDEAALRAAGLGQPLA
jgi:hypothetical protein